jgi:N-acetyl-anhydromuramyl-L-alanine amidase AmpD
MTQAPQTQARQPNPTNWRRAIRVWTLLLLALTVTTLIGWAMLPSADEAPPAVVPTDPAAVERIVWPRKMAPGRMWRYIVVHHSATTAGTLEAIDAGQRGRGFTNGVAYHFLINNGRSAGTADGQILPTARWLGQLDGAHTKVASHPEFNTEGIGICLIGNFDLQEPTAAQMASLEMLVLALKKRYQIPLEGIFGHGELKNTRCPGRLFPLETFLMALRQDHLKRLVSNVSAAEPD